MNTGHRGSASNSSLPVVQVRSQGGSGKSKSKKSGSWLRTVIEFLFFMVWLFCTGVAGYFIGYDPAATECSETAKASIPQPVINTEAKKAACPASKLKPIDMNSPLFKPEGFTIEELKTMWECSHAEAEDSEVNKQIFPDDMSMKKTKWKSIITVEPKRFFKKYLSQYPADTRAVQPVVVFSHKPLQNFEEMSEVCKVIDIAIVPDKPGVCVAVTETYHDVASYHMLHADRQKDGTFALTGNSIEGRTLPSEPAYAAARALLLDFFKYGEKVNKAVEEVPRFSKGRVVVGVLVDDTEDLELFLNSVASAAKVGISKNKFAVFTTSETVLNDMKNTKIKVIYIPELTNVGTTGDGNVGPKVRRYFLQAWLAFACANSLNKVMWQSPATYWLERPDNIVNAYPAVESLWAYKGRNDKRSAPFFVTFDFFVAVGQERPVHLLHELLLHFDLIVAWDSLDAVAAYRLSENNSRYGTTTYVMAPHKVLHTELMAHDPLKVKAAVEVKDEADKPYVIIVPKDFTDPTKAKQFMIDAGLWLM
eukprot:gene12234-14167_t